MKKFYFKQLFTVLLLLCSAIASAHDLVVDGIYYEITDAVNKTVAVTYRGSSFDAYSNEYSGAVIIPASVTYNRTTYRVTHIGYGAFCDCSGLTSIEIPNSVTSIGDGAFFGCDGLTSIEIPNSVTSIGDDAFSYCYALKSVVIPNCVTSIGNWAFAYCDGLTSIEIPNSVTSIGEGAFSDCYGLTSIEIPNSVTSVGDWAFNGCYGFSSIEIPNSVTSIGNYAFAYCDGLTSIEIPNSVTSIGEGAFRGCDGLTSIVVKEGNTVYDSRNNCNAVIETATNTLVVGCKNTIIPDGITSIGDGAFAHCDGLTSIEIPNSVTSIGSQAFYNCDGLTSIVIPNSVTSIGNWAFGGCSGLTSVKSYILAENLFAIDSYVFKGVNKSTCTLYVPYGAKATYAATKGWYEFTNIVELNSFDLTISAAKYATLYLDYNAVVPEDVRVYYAEKIEGETLLMERINDVIPANTGVIVTGAAGTYTFEQTREPVAAIEKNLFQGSVEDSYITPEKDTKYYVLSMVDGVVGMYRDELADGTFKNNAFKAYLPLSGESLGIFDTTVNAPDAQLSNRYTFNFGGITAVEVVNAEKASEAIYNLNGQRVENPTKGIYIVNGKKVIY